MLRDRYAAVLTTACVACVGNVATRHFFAKQKHFDGEGGRYDKTVLAQNNRIAGQCVKPCVTVSI